MSTYDYIRTLEKLKSGDLGLLRTHTGQGIDHSSQAFDLFAGLWWPLRQKSPRAPRREVAWLIAKLYAYRPLKDARDQTLARQLTSCQPRASPEWERIRKRFDAMLMQPLSNMEEPLRWALNRIHANGGGLDWVQLTDDLSIWERESVRLRWAEEFMGPNREEN